MFQVETVHIHPEYRIDDGRLEADLAVLVLKEVVQYTLYVRPICLWTFSIDINRIVGQTGTVSSLFIQRLQLTEWKII